MRNFRTAAVALATATTVAFGGVSAASAAEPDTQSQSSSFTGSSKLGDRLNADEEVAGTDLLGKETNDENNDATWSLVWRDGTIAAGIVAAIGGLIAAYNHAVYTGILPQHILDPIFRR
ncbi:hypothetical protein CBE89_05685 [Corynebacterium striatum]|uniref:Or membrane protein n=1 Tax=Corynebacterium striatum TaxID=43770 RepID=A0A2Z2IXP0_CORST|nr:hypothetical protein [Corynebacterium striatum]ART21049.1 hypothetical protein CBE89_05685 [Corynebacterium striatum]